VKRKFTKLIESTIARFTSGGVLVGDVVKLKRNILSHELIKDNEQMKAKLKELLNSDLNLRVVSIKNKNPMPSSGNNDQNIAPFRETIDIAQEIAPSRFYNYISVPLDAIEVVSTYPNLPPIPDSWKHKSKITLKPEPVKKAEQNDEFAIGNQTLKSNVNGKNVVGDRVLKDKNTPIPASPAEGHKDPASYTANYMPKKS